MMLDQKQTDSLQAKIKIIKIIAGSLVMGCIVMLAVVFGIKKAPHFSTSLGVFAIIGIAFGASAFMASFIVPIIARNQATRALTDEVRDRKKEERIDDSTLSKVFAAFQSTTIIRFALIEGALFLNIMLWFLEGSVFNLVVIAVGLMLMVICFPTESRVITNLESMGREIESGGNLPI